MSISSWMGGSGTGQSGSALASLLGINPSGGFAAQNPLVSWGGTAQDPHLGAEVSAGAQIKAAETAAEANRYGSDKQLEGLKYGSNQQLAGTKYGSDQQLAAANLPYQYKRDVFGQIFPLFQSYINKYLMSNSNDSAPQYLSVPASQYKSFSTPQFSSSYGNPLGNAILSQMGR